MLLKGTRIVIPPQLQGEVLEFIHSGHQGIVKCRRRAQGSVWWMGLSKQVDQLVRNCQNCVEQRSNPKETFVKDAFPKYPWQKIGVDFFKCKNQWYLIVTDYYSRFFEIIPLSQLKEEVVICQIKHIFARYGICEVMRSDNGPQFGYEFSKFAKEYNFCHITSSPYYSQSNGAIEAAVKIAKSLI